MSVEVEQLTERAAKLSAGERAELAAKLIQSLDPPAQDDPAEIERAWIVEAKRRWDDFKRGEAEMLDGDEVMARLRERLG